MSAYRTRLLLTLLILMALAALVVLTTGCEGLVEELQQRHDDERVDAAALAECRGDLDACGEERAAARVALAECESAEPDCAPQLPRECPPMPECPPDAPSALDLTMARYERWRLRHPEGRCAMWAHTGGGCGPTCWRVAVGDGDTAVAKAPRFEGALNHALTAAVRAGCEE